MTMRSGLSPESVALRYMRLTLASGMSKVAGEVRFIKDRSGDEGQWAFAAPGATKREITEDFEFNPRNLKPIAKCLRATNSALGFALSAYNAFAKMSSRNVSGDGLLGGKGYVQKITDMRRQYMNVVEALSAMSDTLRDEAMAPHWSRASRELSKSDAEDVDEDLEEAGEIKKDPAGWAEEEMEEG